MSNLTLGEQAQRLRIYIGESDRWRGRALYAEILELLRKNGLAGATVLRGVAGFGARSRIHTAAILRLSEDLPLVIDIIDDPQKIQKAIELVQPMVSEGLITLEDVRVLKYTHRYLNPMPVDHLVEEVMTREVQTVSPQTSISLAWKKMLHTSIKAFPVINQEKQVVGIVTDEDLIERAGIQQRLAVATRMDPQWVSEEMETIGQSALTVENVMSTPVVTAHYNESLGSAAARMVRNGLKRLPVVDQKQKLVGMLSRLDILKLTADKSIQRTATEPRPGDFISMGDVMLTSFPAVQESDMLPVIIEKLVESEQHKLVVVDELNRPVGIISDSDVVGRVHTSQQKGLLQALRRLAHPPINKLTAAEIMSPGVVCIPQETTLIEAVKRMLSEGRKVIFIVDPNGSLVGAVTRSLLMDIFTMG